MSKYICEACNKPKPIDTSALQVGDNVEFHVQVIGLNSTSTRSKTGVITAIDGDTCRIDSNGATHIMSRDGLTPSDAADLLAYIFGQCECQPAEAEAQ